MHVYQLLTRQGMRSHFGTPESFFADMEELWKSPDVLKEWIKFGKRHGKVRFSIDLEK